MVVIAGIATQSLIGAGSSEAAALMAGDPQNQGSTMSCTRVTHQNWCGNIPVEKLKTDQFGHFMTRSDQTKTISDSFTYWIVGGSQESKSATAA